MKIFDVHSHWGTERGYPLRGEAQLARQRKTWGSEVAYWTEEGTDAYFRKMNVQAILTFGFTKKLPIEQMREYHDYAFETQRRFPKTFYGNWISMDPRLGKPALQELERCFEVGGGFVGFSVSPSTLGLSPADDLFDPFYKLSIDAKRPVLISVGTVGLGAGLPGGGGMLLKWGHPLLVDEVAAKYPDLTIIAGRPAWPWQTEMIAVMLHKPNVWAELHGWSPKHYTQDLKYELRRRLKDRVMFGADFPLFTYERLIADWHNEGFPQEVLDNVFYNTAARLFGLE